ncbi:MAG: hypothetical protein LBG86_01790 [Puniceicoccales bacterium]|jgi:hypothetical protein|nr:hypothetical protein [Puniceicoccales bacterium]
MPETGDGSNGGGEAGNGKISAIFSDLSGSTATLNKLYQLLAKVVATQEKDLNDAIKDVGETASSIDQGVLLRVQAMVQTWAVTSGLATGTLRAAGDALNKVTQNIR